MSSDANKTEPYMEERDLSRDCSTYQYVNCLEFTQLSQVMR